MEDVLYLLLWIGLLGFVIFMVTTYIPMDPPWKVAIQVIGVVALIILVLRFVASSRLFAALAAMALLVSPIAAGDFSVLATGILAMHAKASPSPVPTPTPTPSGICDNCGGTGKLGDGTVSVTCPVCDGTGKKKTQYTGAVSQPAASTLRSVATPPVYQENYQPRRGFFRRRGG